jgi:hypothetical protein
MATRLTTIRNIGPAMESAFKSAGITSAETLREMGADAAYRCLVATGHRPHFIAYCALAMGLQGRSWNDCQGAEKVELRTRFDAIVSQVSAPQTSLARVLDEIGVRIDDAPGD